jgi:hypothetical protein
MAWEGGHADHDAAHLIGLAVARSQGVLEQTWEFSLYNGYRVPWKLFRVLSPIPRPQGMVARRLTWSEAFRTLALCFKYPSQWKTWVGLFPPSLYRLLVVRKEILVRADLARIRALPHPGRVLYERRMRISGAEFMARSQSFRERLLPGTPG